ncbi:MAG: glycosyltransferase family 39 protein [Deltaproteobacteria bacterium]|nr:glycosyltransferase family 39 protein [Deltaproteobacteria bacterium]
MKSINTESLFVGRILSFIFFLLGTVFLYRFTSRQYGEAIAWWVLIFWGNAPLLLAYSTQFLAEMGMMVSFLGALYFISQYFDTKRVGYYWAALLCGMAMPAFRYYGAFLFIPLLFYGWNRESKINFRLGCFFVLPIIIPSLWLMYSLTAVENPITMHQNYENWHWGAWKYYLWDSFFYYEIMFSRLSQYILTYVGFALFILGIFLNYRDFFLLSSLFMMALSMGIFTLGHHNHEYYQVKFIPFLVILASSGAVYVFDKLRYLKRSILVVTLAVLFCLSLSHAYKLLRYDSSGKVLGEKLAAYSSPTDKILLIQDVPDPAVLVYSQRQGWLKNKSFLEEKMQVPQEANLLGIRFVSSQFALPYFLKDKYTILWQESGPMGRQHKCGFVKFFLGECVRDHSTVMILKPF